MHFQRHFGELRIQKQQRIHNFLGHSTWNMNFPRSLRLHFSSYQFHVTLPTKTLEAEEPGPRPFFPPFFSNKVCRQKTVCSKTNSKLRHGRVCCYFFRRRVSIPIVFVIVQSYGRNFDTLTAWKSARTRARLVSFVDATKVTELPGRTAYFRHSNNSYNDS